MLSIGQTMQNDDNYFKDGHLMPPGRLPIDVLLLLVVLSLVTNIVVAALTLMHASTPVRRGVKSGGSQMVSGQPVLSSPGSLAVASMRFASIT